MTLVEHEVSRQPFGPAFEKRPASGKPIEMASNGARQAQNLATPATSLRGSEPGDIAQTPLENSERGQAELEERGEIQSFLKLPGHSTVSIEIVRSFSAAEATCGGPN